MYDGEHSYDSHYKALPYYIDCMDDIFIFVIDDWNWEQVRESTNKSIEDLKLKVLWKKEIKLSDDNSTTHEKTTWWNGIGIFLLQKNKNYENK
jgi:asparagine synthetase A